MESTIYIFNNVFLALVEVDEIEILFPQNKTSNTIHTRKRFLEKEGIKYLLKKHLPKNTLIYNKNGKPHLKEGGYLSISHSKSLIGLAWSHEINIGLDIEEISPKIDKIHNRFIHDLEKEIAITQEEKTIIWCVKEAMVKILDNKSINFKQNLRVIKKSNPDEWVCFANDDLTNAYVFSVFKTKNNIVCIHTKLE